ncbi:hypothetical protein [Gryllotalpicola ginsengisoli]|uniref:hypothetical protein n=1 Tax=Gryllotalpicola ginsengisoli TaxID=444608 RepID=UPI0003B4D454|nr:hypothetical protein [Gryllotalpicola ginsengisoli]
MSSRDRALWAARAAAAAVLVVIVVALSILTSSTVHASRADAAAGAVSPTRAHELPRFEAGDIISDDAFYDADAMTEQGIQDWLLAMPCAPTDLSPCLAFYHQATRTVAADGNCSAYQGEADETAAQIVYKVAHACGISPRVLLVLVQKEQSLITRPSAYGYQRATGYACPDTAPCDAKYFGFFNQLYKAAWQFREYGDASDGWRYHVGRVRIAYSPDASCGASVVDIENQATANLYNYTPYQPDAQTRENPSGPGTRCSAYGNLNFFRLYNAWFGDSRATHVPLWWGECLSHLGGSTCRSGN